MRTWSIVFVAGVLLLAGCSDDSADDADAASGDAAASVDISTSVDSETGVDGSNQTDALPDDASGDTQPAQGPIRVLFVVDTSSSMQFNDPAEANVATCKDVCQAAGVSAATCDDLCGGATKPGRQAAVEQIISSTRGNLSAAFAVLGFAGQVAINADFSVDTIDDTGFTRDEELLGKATRGLAKASGLSDYQGALHVLPRLLENDMTATDPAVLAKTRYVIVFLSDGSPSPACSRGCDNDKQAIGGLTVTSWCDLPRSTWCDRVADDGVSHLVIAGVACENLKASFVGMTDPCEDYNRNADIVTKIEELGALAQRYGVAELVLHTALVVQSDLPQAIKDFLDLDKTEAEILLKHLARAGKGTYRAFSSGQAIDLSHIDFGPVPE